jgi:hypothetical protein
VLKCKDCRFFDEKRGECKFTSPVVLPNGGTYFPQVSENNWCGEWKPMMQGNYIYEGKS